MGTYTISREYYSQNDIMIKGIIRKKANIKTILKDLIKKTFIWISFKILSLLSLKKFPFFRSLVCLVPHPDDEIIGIGGFLLKSIRQGCKVYLIYLTDGEGSRVWPDQNEIRSQRVALSEYVCEKLALKKPNIYRLHLVDGMLPCPDQAGFVEVVQHIKQLIETIKPDAVFSTHLIDYWPYDHVACAYIAREVIKQLDKNTQLWYYWVWAWYYLKPWQLLNLKYKRMHLVNINTQFEQKKELMNIYLNSLTSEGKPWSGVLPKSMLYPFTKPFEILERYEFI